MKKVIYIFEPGINYGVSSWRGWAGKAVEWTIVEKNIFADSVVYHTTALTVWIHERQRAISLARKIIYYVKAGYIVHLVGHSNGTRVILDALRQLNLMHDLIWQVGNVYLVSGACDSNFERNGLNNLLYTGKVRQVFCYRAGKDWAMKIENTIFGKALFQMEQSDRPLGLVGPQNVRLSNSAKWAEIIQSGYGHSDWWLPKNFAHTMAYFFA